MSKHSKKHKHTLNQKPQNPNNHNLQTPSNPIRPASSAIFTTAGPNLLHPTIKSTNLELNLLDALANRPASKGLRLDPTSRSNISLMSHALQADRNPYLAKYHQFPTDIDYGAYDRIEVDASQFKRLVDLASDFSPSTVFELLEHPTLPEFVCNIADDYEGTTTICFKSTIVPNSILSLACLNSNEPCQAYVDAYLSSDRQTTELACCFGLAINSHYTLGTMCYESPDIKLSEKQTNALIYNAARFYLAVQLLLRERPEIIVQRSRQAVPLSTTSKKTKKSKPRKIRYVKVHYLDDESLHAFRPKRHYTSPSGTFGVRGHWRHLKGGRRVWVKPHIKGIDKDGYQTKDYELPHIPTDHKPSP